MLVEIKDENKTLLTASIDFPTASRVVPFSLRKLKRSVGRNQK